MPVTRQRKLQIEQRRRQVAELTLKGLRQSDIAAQLAVGQATVSADLKRIRAAWRDSGLRDFDAAISEQLEALALVEREAWEAWERSKRPSHTAVIQGPADEQQTRQTLKHRDGDPRFLEQVQKCLARSRELLGLGDARRREAEELSKPKPYRLNDLIEELNNPLVPNPRPEGCPRRRKPT